MRRRFALLLILALMTATSGFAQDLSETRPADGARIDSVEGTGIHSVDGTGIDSVEGTGLRNHTIKPGETLGAIAKRYYGNATQWTRIYEANRATLNDPNRLKVGGTLKIPAAM